MHEKNVSRSNSWRGWILLPLGLLVVAIAGRWLFVSVSGQVLHPNPQAIPSVTPTDPSLQWSAAVDRTRRMLRAALAEQNLPGLSVAVGAGGDIVWTEGFGWTDIETRSPVTPDTRFRMGTASTVLTSAAVGVLVEKGRLGLDHGIQTYVPQYPEKQWPVTLGQLMAHTGGTGTDGGDDGPLFRQRCERPVEALPHFADSALLFEPGTQYRHSKYGWILVSAAVEAAAEQPFLTFMREQVFQPLGMKNTGAESAKAENPDAIGEEAEDAPFLTLIREVILQPLGIAAKRAKPATEPATAYVRGSALSRHGLKAMRPHNLSCYAGSMAFFSTPSDLVRFGLGMKSGKVIQPDTAQLLLASPKLASGRETGHGLGWDLESATVAGIHGELRGRVLATLLTFRETGIVVAVMANSVQADTPGLAAKVAEAFAPMARK